LDRLVPHVYAELRQIAHRHLRDERRHLGHRVERLREAFQ